MTKENKNLFVAGFILGLGILGAIDGVVFHQLLQWHHMIMSPNIHLEIYTDGLFTAAFSALMVWGAIKIFRDAKKGELGHSGDIFLSGILIGGGVFNLVEGIIDHHILQVHRVNPMAENPLMYDLAFLASGVILILIGYWLKNQGQKVHD